jgi:hypothetical protein
VRPASSLFIAAFAALLAFALSTHDASAQALAEYGAALGAASNAPAAAAKTVRDAAPDDGYDPSAGWVRVDSYDSDRRSTRARRDRSRGNRGSSARSTRATWGGSQATRSRSSSGRS